jgi:hypothetical protein
MIRKGREMRNMRLADEIDFDFDGKCFASCYSCFFLFRLRPLIIWGLFLFFSLMFYNLNTYPCFYIKKHLSISIDRSKMKVNEMKIMLVNLSTPFEELLHNRMTFVVMEPIRHLTRCCSSDILSSKLSIELDCYCSYYLQNVLQDLCCCFLILYCCLFFFFFLRKLFLLFLFLCLYL